MSRLDVRAGQRFAGDEIVKNLVDFQIGDPDPRSWFAGLGHWALPDRRGNEAAVTMI
jgi:hypothetical protein